MNGANGWSFHKSCHTLCWSACIKVVSIWGALGILDDSAVKTDKSISVQWWNGTWKKLKLGQKKTCKQYDLMVKFIRTYAVYTMTISIVIFKICKYTNQSHLILYTASNMVPRSIGNKWFDSNLSSSIGAIGFKNPQKTHGHREFFLFFFICRVVWTPC